MFFYLMTSDLRARKYLWPLTSWKFLSQLFLWPPFLISNYAWKFKFLFWCKMHRNVFFSIGTISTWVSSSIFMWLDYLVDTFSALFFMTFTYDLQFFHEKHQFYDLWPPISASGKIFMTSDLGSEIFLWPLTFILWKRRKFLWPLTFKTNFSLEILWPLTFIHFP